MKQTCAQRGCTFDADQVPAKCPVCNNPMIDADTGDGIEAEAPWSDYTKAELQQYADAWGVEGVTGRTTKAELIALLETAEAADAEAEAAA